jgi:hypothetical protein
MKLKDILLSCDFLCAVIIAVFIAIISPYWLPNEFVKDLYSIGISVLSIIFSVFFAALAIMMSSSDDEFVVFLEEEGDYTKIIASFEVSLGIIFVALMYSIIIYGITSYWFVNKHINQQYYWLSIFCFLFLYGLFAVANSALDSMIFSKYRTRFINIRKSKKACYMTVTSLTETTDKEVAELVYR